MTHVDFLEIMYKAWDDQRDEKSSEEFYSQMGDWNRDTFDNIFKLKKKVDGWIRRNRAKVGY